MSTILDYRYRFNGVVSTDKTVMQNLEAMTSAAGSWLTYDIHSGKWSVVINKPETSVAMFNDDNILGPLTVMGSGLTDLYNSVKVEFPHLDLNDATDFVQDDIPEEDLNPNETKNTLVMQYDIFNDPVQAELLGLLELKQSRTDKIIKFQTDYSKIGIRAGDVISVTNTLYGFVDKKFRVTVATESDNDDGSIVVDITAMEYDESVYDTSDLYRYIRSNQTGIITPGALPAPGQPELTMFSNVSRPYLKMESTITSTDANSLVEGVEFWYSTDANAASESSRVYYLAGVDRPANDRTFINGETSEFDWVTTTTGNVFVKARSFNSQTTGPFSEVSSLLYQPVQIPDAVPVANATTGGDDLWDMLALAAALAALNGMMNNDTSEGSILGNINVNTAGVTSIQAGSGISINANQGDVTISATGGTNGLWQGAARYVSSSQPIGTFNNGDVWFKIP